MLYCSSCSSCSSSCVSHLISILYPVSLAASLAFCPSLPIASESWFSGTITFAVFSSSSASTETTFAGLNEFSIRTAGESLHVIMSIFSPFSSSTIAFTRLPLILLFWYVNLLPSQCSLFLLFHPVFL